MAKKKPSYDDIMQALDVERRKALSDCDYAAYSTLCDQCGIIDDESAYERGLADRREVIPLEELQEDAGGLEEVVRDVAAAIDDAKFTPVVRSYIAGKYLRTQGDLKTPDSGQYADWIREAFLDFTQNRGGYGIKVDSKSGVSSGRMRHVYFGANFLEKIVGRGTYRTEYSAGFDEDHDDSDKTNPETYQVEELSSLKQAVSQRLPDANVVVKGNHLYVFKKE